MRLHVALCCKPPRAYALDRFKLGFPRKEESSGEFMLDDLLCKRASEKEGTSQQVALIGPHPRAPVKVFRDSLPVSIIFTTSAAHLISAHIDSKRCIAISH